MSGEEFANKFKIGSATVYRIETGSRVPGPKIIRILDEAGICTHKDFYAPPVDDGGDDDLPEDAEAAAAATAGG